MNFLQRCFSTLIVGAVSFGSAMAQTQPEKPPDYCSRMGDAVDGVVYNSFIDSLQPNLDLPFIRQRIHICLGENVYWKEQDGSSDKRYVRRFDFQRLQRTGGYLLPLIIWAHPNGKTEAIDQSTQDSLGSPALLHGFAFMSIQTRHPTSSQCKYTTPPAPGSNQPGQTPPNGRELPSTDIAEAVKFARYHADDLQIDPDNIYLVGQSRGSAVILNALIADQQGQSQPSVNLSDCDEASAAILQDYRDQSSKPKAVFGVQAQSTYDNTQVRNSFVEDPAVATVAELTTRPGTTQHRDIQFPQCENGQQYSYNCHYDKSRQVLPHISGNPISALNAINNSQLNPDGVPIWIRYDRSPMSNAAGKVALYINEAGTRQDAADIDNSDNCFEHSTTCLDVHHPLFGKRLVDNYNSIASGLPSGSRTWIYAEYGDAAYEKAGKARRDLIGSNFYKNYYCFFLQYKRHGEINFRQNIDDDANVQRKMAIKAYNDGRTGADPMADKTFCGLSVDDDPWLP